MAEKPAIDSHLQPARPTGARVETAAAVAVTKVVLAPQVRDSARLVLGSQVEVLLKALHKSGDLEVQLRALNQGGGLGSWSPSLRVGLTDELRAALLEVWKWNRLQGAQPKTTHASIPESVRPGARLRAEVVAVTPKLMLRLLTDEVDSATTRRALIDTQLRLHLPGARPLTTALSNLKTTVQLLAQINPGHTANPASQSLNPASVTQPERRELGQAVQQLFNHLPHARELTNPARLAEMLRHSGIWLESMLVRASVNPDPGLQRDLKTQLLRLAEQLRATTQRFSVAQPQAQQAQQARAQGSAPGPAPAMVRHNPQPPSKGASTSAAPRDQGVQAPSSPTRTSASATSPPARPAARGQPAPPPTATNPPARQAPPPPGQAQPQRQLHSVQARSDTTASTTRQAPPPPAPGPSSPTAQARPSANVHAPPQPGQPRTQPGSQPAPSSPPKASPAPPQSASPPALSGRPLAVSPAPSSPISAKTSTPTTSGQPLPTPAQPGPQVAVHAQIPPARLPVESAQVGERLLQLASQISREVDGMLKQLVTLQLHNADNGPDQQQRWLLELPVQSSAGLLTLDTEIDHQQEPGDGEEDHWSMQLRLDLPKLGPLLIQLSLREGRLHANLIAEQSAGAQMLQSHLQELRTQLEHRDLNIASLHARSGPTGRPPKARAPLLNERA